MIYKNFIQKSWIKIHYGSSKINIPWNFKEKSAMGKFKN